MLKEEKQPAMCMLSAEAQKGMNLGSPRNPKNSLQRGRGTRLLIEDDFWAQNRSQWMDHKVNNQGQETEGALSEMGSHTLFHVR